MVRKTWNVRDQPKKKLEEMLLQKYKKIEDEYEMLRKISRKEDAKKLVDEIWAMKALANTIEIELMKREYNNGTAS